MPSPPCLLEVSIPSITVIPQRQLLSSCESWEVRNLQEEAGMISWGWEPPEAVWAWPYSLEASTTSVVCMASPYPKESPLPCNTFIPKPIALCTYGTNLPALPEALLPCLMSYHSPGQKLLVLPKACQNSSGASFLPNSKFPFLSFLLYS